MVPFANVLIAAPKKSSYAYVADEPPLTSANFYKTLRDDDGTSHAPTGETLKTAALELARNAGLSDRLPRTAPLLPLLGIEL